MKKLLILMLAACMMLCTTSLAEETVQETEVITPEPNTMVAKIDGELVTLYLAYAGDYEVQFKRYDENGETDMLFYAYMGKSAKKGTYNEFTTKGIDRCWLNTDYSWSFKGVDREASFTQYIGGNFGGTVLGGNGTSNLNSNEAEIVLRIDKATGYRNVGVFNAILHDVKKDNFVSVQAKFDYTIGETYDFEAAAKKNKKETSLSLDDIDF